MRLVSAIRSCLVFVLLAAVVTDCAAEEKPPEKGKIVLDTFSYWRCHVTLQPVLFGTRDDAKPHKLGTIHPNISRRPVVPADQPRTPPPPDDWMQPGFDDSAWWRQPGPFFGGEILRSNWAMPVFSHYGSGQPSSIALVCLRGKFTVTDPAQVKSLKISVNYRGGLMIYLNGKEIARSNLPEGEIDKLTLADDYPWEAWVAGEAYRYLFREWARKGVEVRERKVENLELPGDLLVKGVNVVALEIHRSAQHGNILTHRGGRPDRYAQWNTAGLISARLLGEGEGVTPNAGRPPGFRVWNATALESVFECSYGDPNEPLRPTRIEGARNGFFSAQVVTGSDKSIKGLRAEVTDLKHREGKGAIPASEIRIRYPLPTAKEKAGKYLHKVLGGWGGFHSYRYDALYDEPRDEIPVQTIGRNWKRLYPNPVWLGAVQPVWITLKVPPDAAPGSYRGSLTVRAEGAEPVEVPIEMEVNDYRLPDPNDFQTSVGFLEFPESLSDYYNVAPWSGEHWKLVEMSMDYLVRTGSRLLFVPLICRTHFRNRESMVRWVREGDGYIHDYSHLEQYLDAALRTGFRPRVVVLQVWDYHVGSNPRKKIGTGVYGQSWIRGQVPVPVSLLDPRTGRISEMKGPKYTDPGAESFWKPVADRVVKILKERGLDKTIMMGNTGDYIPVKETVDLWAKLIPGAPWVTMGHGTTSNLYGHPVGYSTAVFIAYFRDPGLERKLGWKRPSNVAYFPRYADSKATFGMSYERTFFEFGMLCGLRGAGRQSLDDFHPYGVRGAWGSDCCWGSLTPGPAWLAPGRGGPIGTERFEMGLEGLQECEARIFIEKALDDEAKKARLGGELAAECQAILDKRTRCVAWGNEQNTNGRFHSYLPFGPLGSDWYACGSDWQARSARLYSAAARVSKLLGK